MPLQAPPQIVNLPGPGPLIGLTVPVGEAQPAPVSTDTPPAPIVVDFAVTRAANY